jgi:acetyl esterase/lipase
MLAASAVVGLALAMSSLAFPVLSAVAATTTALTPGAHGPKWSGAKSVTYCDNGDQPQYMTLFAPAPALAQHPVPAVLQVHGGGWERGARLTSLSDSGTATDLVRAGFLVASIDYRLAPQNPWPDQIVDVECAVRYLRAHASDLGIEPDRIAALGTSAGGQLVSLLATAGDLGQWDVGSNPDVSDRVAAVVDEFGPSNLTAPGWPHASSVFIHTVFGADPGTDSATLKEASPVTYVAPDDPPFLIIQGTDDHVIPESQSTELAERLRSAGVPVDVVLVHGGQHGLMTPDETPSPSAISSLITSYLEKTLHP